MFIDLHTHTTCSDGTLTPEALVKYAHVKGLAAVAVTDHDTVAGNTRAVHQGEKIHIEVIPGVEFSASCPRGSLHILGYFVDSGSDIIKTVNKLQKKRRERNLKIIQKLHEIGYHINKDAFCENAYLGRPHIARELVQSGHVKTIEEAFQKFLKRGASAYVKREKLSERETVETIIKAEGVPVLAHPITVFNPEETVKRLVLLGLKGIEVYYPTHSQEDTLYFEELSKKYKLVMTGGSDFHGEHKPDIDLGCMKVPAHLLKNLKEIKK